MVIDELVSPSWNRTHATNYATNGFPTIAPTVTMPSGDGVIAFGCTIGAGPPGFIAGAYCPHNLVLVPYGAGAATNTFLLNVYGWRPTNLGIGVPLWVPVKIAACTVTIGTATGVANSDLVATNLFATTITNTLGPTLVAAGATPTTFNNWFEISPGSNDIGAIVVPSLGFPLLQVALSTGGVATNCNALWSKL